MSLPLALLAASLVAQPIELRLGHDSAPGSLFAISADEFAKRVNEKLQGKVVLRVWGASRLGDDLELLQKTKQGLLDFAIPSSVMSSVVPAFGLFEMPYLVEDRRHMKRIEKEILWPQLAPLAEQAGYHIVAVWENGFRQITNNVRPIVVPADLKNLKLRVPPGEWRMKLFQAFGASPSRMGLGRVYAALQSGVMDGQEGPLSQIQASRFDQVQKFLSLTNHVYTPAFLVIAPRKWAALPPDVRKVLDETARELQPFVQETAERMDRELTGKLKALGMQVNEADKEAFRRAGEAVYEEFGRQVPGGAAMIAKARKLRSEK